jgi:hypothetical protein
MAPRRAADRGTAATLAGSESLGEVATPTCTPCVSPGATIGRFLAAGDRVLEPARHEPARHLLEHRSRELALNEVFGAALGDLEQQPLGIRRVAAEVGHGVLLRGAWPPPCWVCRSRAPAPCSGPARRPPLHHTTRPPRPRSDRPGCCRRTARSDGPAPAGRGNRCTSAPPFEDARPAEGGFLIRAASTSPATTGLPAVPGVAALLRVHPSQHQLRLVSGALPPSSPTAFLARPCGCRRRLLWPLFGVAATRPDPTAGPLH